MPYSLIDNIGDQFHSILVRMQAVKRIHVISVTAHRTFKKISNEKVFPRILNRSFYMRIKDLCACFEYYMRGNVPCSQENIKRYTTLLPDI